MAETAKAFARRTRENWFNRYAPDWLAGIDIGCQRDFLNETFRRWDMIYGDEDATFMHGVSDGKFRTVYASHVLEHLPDPVAALQNWFRILKPGGHLIVCVPHRDLYEKKTTLPSKWNGDHKTFWLPEVGEPPVTLGLRETIAQAVPTGKIVYVRVLDEGFESHGPENHSGGEYSIEAVVEKPG
jgi:ubiquinone/menaquinone biosynthesis C-methylase UbiE